MTDEKPIIFILIATGTKPLASYSEYEGEFKQKSELILPTIQPNTSLAINYGNFFVFYSNEDNITYLLIALPTLSKATAVACIESLRKELRNNLIGRNFDNVDEYGLNDEIYEKLKMKFDFYNEHKEATSESLENLKSAIEKMRDKVEEAKNELLIRDAVMIEMADKAQELKESGQSLKKNATKVRKKTVKSKVLIYVGIGIALIVILYLIFAMVCSWDFKCD